METQRAEPTVSLPPWSVEEAYLLRDAKAGDLQAFGQLVQLHQASVFTTALRLTDRRADAVELSLAAFAALYGALPRISNPTHLTRWLSRTVAQRAPGWLLEEAKSGDVVMVEEPGGEPHGHAESARDEVPDPGADFVSRVLVRLEQRRSHRRRARATAGRGNYARRRMLWGLLLLAVVGVALLALQWSGLRWPMAGTAPKAKVVADAAPAAEPVHAVQGGEAAVVPAAPPVSQGQAALQDVYPRYTLIVMPLQQQAQDAATRESAAAFHAALLEELRKVPDLTLLVPGISAPPVDAGLPADYLLTVTSLQTTALASGGVAFRVAAGGNSDLLSTAAGRQSPIEIRMRPLGQAQAGSFTSTVQLGATDSTAQVAAKQVEMLRTRFFPDALLRLQLTARLRDGALSSVERERALSDLIGTDAPGGAPGLDAVNIDALVQQAAVMRADQRAQLWRSLRGAYYPELVGPLLGALRQDPEEDVRFEALATLAANYAGDTGVRAAIESVAREDPQQVVRMAAQRALNGEAAWRSYVLATLGDASLSYADRMAPLLLAVHSAVTPAEIAGAKVIASDAQTMGLLVGMVRDGWFDGAQTEAVGDALGLLANGGNAAVSDVLVQVMPEAAKPVSTVQPQTQASATVPAAQVSAETMAWLVSHRNNPRVRRMLDDISRGDPDPRVEAIVEQMRRAEQMQRPPPRR